jgi:VanZ family protein
MALIWALSSLSTLPSIEEIPFKDKGAHFIEYAALGFLYRYALTRQFAEWKALKVVLFTIFCALVWGLLDELHQAFVPGRDSSLLDVCADVLGAIIGAALFPLASALSARFLTRPGATKAKDARIGA